jgi:hypothetical protein
MTAWRVFLRITFRGARFEALECDPASAREPFHPCFGVRTGRWFRYARSVLFAEQDSPAGRAELTFMSARIIRRHGLESVMIVVRDPVLQPISITALRPTQMTVGMREVNQKRDHLRTHVAKKIGKFLGDHMIPVVMGPRDRYYIIDHHHLALALHKEGLEHVLVSVVANLSTLQQDAFWIVLDHHAWVHPYDGKGRRREFADIPRSITDLGDDPFRSLAGELRRAGGFAKDVTPFSEFLWADFLRRRMKRGQIEKDFTGALERALISAKSQDARYLPGWCGPNPP